jgi:hypothetical protein
VSMPIGREGDLNGSGHSRCHKYRLAFRGNITRAASAAIALRRDVSRRVRVGAEQRSAVPPRGSWAARDDRTSDRRRAPERLCEARCKWASDGLGFSFDYGKENACCAVRPAVVPVGNSNSNILMV